MSKNLELNKRPEITSGLASKITGFNKVAQVSPVEKKFSLMLLCCS
jgi:hypothetical protein